MGVGALRKFEHLPKWPGGEALAPTHRWWAAPDNSFNNRAYGPMDTIVIHATAGHNSSGAMSVTQSGNASWHWLMPDEDESPHGDHVWRCVADEKKAWHVRKQVKFPIDNKRDINSRSVGIEIVNAQIGEGDPFSQWQVAVTAQTVNYYRSKHPDRRFYLATHSFLDPERRNDPGNIFDWQRFMSLLETGEPELVDVDDYAADAVSWVKEQGLMTGVSEQLFGGRDPVKRQDLAIILKRLHDGLKPADEG